MASVVASLASRIVRNQPKRIGSRIADLCAVLEQYMDRAHIREVYRAYLFSAEAHDGQFRNDGSPYITHPLAVARILAEMNLDYRCLMAALLHDVIEDTGVTKEALVREFSDEVAEMVDGVSKLRRIHFGDYTEAQAANIGKMLLAMTKDIRVILIKLADRLHNMRTLDFKASDKARRIARETLEIYSPIANRFSINHISTELEDLSFSHYWPWRYQCLKKAVAKICAKRVEFIATVQQAIQSRLQQEGIDGAVVSRRKHLYAIYRKMKLKHRSFKNIADVYGVRIIVDRLDSCYRALGVVHNLYEPVPGRFKDYIALPRANGYQSIHTVLNGPGGVRVEVQIRTQDMHNIAEAGLAAHWIYKSPTIQTHKVHAGWLANLLDMQQKSNNIVEFIENVKIDLFNDEVYVFTPKGKVLVLPQGATVVDFAYAVHTDIGDTCVGARVNHHLVPLRTKLRSGQMVEIITAKSANPNPSWLGFIATAKARTRVRNYLKHQEIQEISKLGQSLLDAELKIQSVTWEQIPAERINAILKEMDIASIAELWQQIGLGNILPKLVAYRLRSQLDVPDGKCEQGRFVIKGSAGMMIKFAKCCRPINGDAIIGVLNPGRGLSVHRQDCRNLGDAKRNETNWISVEWEPGAQIDLPVEIKVDMGNVRGMLATVTKRIADADSNIESVHFVDEDGTSAMLSVLVTVHDQHHLAMILGSLRSIPSVMKAVRVQH